MSLLISVSSACDMFLEKYRCFIVITMIKLFITIDMAFVIIIGVDLITIPHASQIPTLETIIISVGKDRSFVVFVRNILTSSGRLAVQPTNPATYAKMSVDVTDITGISDIQFIFNYNPYTWLSCFKPYSLGQKVTESIRTTLSTTPFVFFHSIVS